MSKNIIKPKELKDYTKWREVLASSNINLVHIKTYAEDYSSAKEITKDSPDWEKISKLLEINEPTNDYSKEMFLRLVNEHYKKDVTTGAELWELITQETNNAPDDEEGVESCSIIIEEANIFRYKAYLYYLIDIGESYKDLKELNPQEFRANDIDKEEEIIQAIAYYYNLDEIGIPIMLPSLRKIAEDLKAPYSVIMEAYSLFKLVNKKGKGKRTYDRKNRALSLRIKTKLEEVIKKQTAKWKKERLLDNKKAKTYKETLKNYKQYTVLAIYQIATYELSKAIGSDAVKEYELAEEYVEFLKENFKEEIGEQIKLIIESHSYNRTKREYVKDKLNEYFRD